MDERTDAKRSIESSTRHLTEIANELSRRATPRYLADQAKETALNKTYEWKEQIGTSPLALGIIGGTIGALLGRAFAKERREAYYARPPRPAFADERGVRYGSGVEVEYGSPAWNDRGSSGSVGDKISETAHDLKDKAADVVAGVRDRIPSAGEMASTVRDTAVELGHRADENPMLVALGGLVLGAAAALLLPVSRKERELLEPVKQRAGEAIGALSDKIDGGVQQAREKLSGEQARPGDLSGTGVPALTH